MSDEKTLIALIYSEVQAQTNLLTIIATGLFDNSLVNSASLRADLERTMDILQKNREQVKVRFHVE